MKIVRIIMGIVGIFVLSILGGMFWQVVLLPLLSSQPYIQDMWFVTNYRDREINLYPREEITITENEAVVRQIKEVEKSVVGIRTQVGTSFLNGSGLVYTTDGLIVTLVELVPYNGVPSVWIDGRRLDAEVVNKDLGSGLAVLRVKEEGTFSPVSLREGSVDVGEAVFIVGVDLGSLGTSVIVNTGLIRQVNGLVYLSIYESSSMKGGVVFDLEGKVIGISKIGIDGEVVVVPVEKIDEVALLQRR